MKFRLRNLVGLLALSCSGLALGQGLGSLVGTPDGRTAYVNVDCSGAGWGQFWLAVDSRIIAGQQALGTTQGQMLVATAAAQALTAAYPDRAPFGIPSFGTYAWINLWQGVASNPVFSCWLTYSSGEQYANGPDTSAIVAAVNGVKSSVDSVGSTLTVANITLSNMNAIQQEGLLTEGLLGTIRNDVAAIKNGGSAQPVAVSWAMVGGYWGVGFTTPLALWAMSYFAGGLMGVIRKEMR